MRSIFRFRFFQAAEKARSRRRRKALAFLIDSSLRPHRLYRTVLRNSAAVTAVCRRMHSHFLRIVGAARQTLQKVVELEEEDHRKKGISERLYAYISDLQTVTRHRNLLTLAVTAFAACILFYVYCDKRVEAERNSSILTGPKKHIQASGIDE